MIAGAHDLSVFATLIPPMVAKVISNHLVDPDLLNWHMNFSLRHFWMAWPSFLLFPESRQPCDGWEQIVVSWPCPNKSPHHLGNSGWIKSDPNFLLFFWLWILSFVFSISWQIWHFGLKLFQDSPPHSGADQIHQFLRLLSLYFFLARGLPQAFFIYAAVDANP